MERILEARDEFKHVIGLEASEVLDRGRSSRGHNCDIDKVWHSVETDIENGQESV